MWKPAEALEVDTEARKTLDGWVRARTSPQRVVMRARIVLMAAEGVPNRRIAQTLGTSRQTVLLWRSRFALGGAVALLADAPGRGRPPQIPISKVKGIVKATGRTPPQGAARWSMRTMARAQGVSHSTVQRIWDAHGLQPHQVETVKVPRRHRRFAAKLAIVVGAYLNPPLKAVALCVGGEAQIPALDRTRSGPPLKKGPRGTMTQAQGYGRHWTPMLVAAMKKLEGRVIGTCRPRHRDIEFRRFLREIDQSVPSELGIHIILGKDGTRGHPKSEAWLKEHPRFHLHLAPTRPSWLDLVEGCLGDLTERRTQRGWAAGVPDLIGAVQEFLAAHDDKPRAFVWTARFEKMLRKARLCKAIFDTHP